MAHCNGFAITHERLHVLRAMFTPPFQVAEFVRQLDEIGAKSIPNYATYANSFIHSITIPGCSTPGKVFVGQRADGFVVNLGETFDLVNIKYPAEELAPGMNARCCLIRSSLERYSR